MNILAVVGSLRKESYNHQLAQAAQKMVLALDPQSSLEILKWNEVPFFNEDIEFPPPTAVTQARKAVKQADGVWIFTPEYNHSYPGSLKNLLDWLSRPEDKDTPHVLAGKPVAFCGTSIGPSGGSHAQDNLATLLSLLGVQLMNAPRLVIPSITQQTTDTGMLALTSSAPYLERHARAFLAFIKHCA